MRKFNCLGGRTQLMKKERGRLPLVRIQMGFEVIRSWKTGNKQQAENKRKNKPDPFSLAHRSSI
jgi:hypothetical protein